MACPLFAATSRLSAPFLQGRTAELKDWSDIKLLSVAVDRLRHWSRNGLLCIGDSAHAMSPIGGVGINLAIQDAVAAANILVPALSTIASDNPHIPSPAECADVELHHVQARREFPTRMTQASSDLRPQTFHRPRASHQSPTQAPPPPTLPPKALPHPPPHPRPHGRPRLPPRTHPHPRLPPSSER